MVQTATPPGTFNATVKLSQEFNAGAATPTLNLREGDLAALLAGCAFADAATADVATTGANALQGVTAANLIVQDQDGIDITTACAVTICSDNCSTASCELYRCIRNRVYDAVTGAV